MSRVIAEAVVALLAGAEGPWSEAPVSTVREVAGREAADLRTWAPRDRDAFSADGARRGDVQRLGKG